jgi:hypothetical protein
MVIRECVSEEIIKLCEQQEELMVTFYRQAYGYYRITGHDLLETDKLELVIARAKNKEVIRSLIGEGKEQIARAEVRIVDTLGALDELAKRSRDMFQQTLAIRLVRQKALARAKDRCADILEFTGENVTLRHLPLCELSRRCLYFGT